MRGLPSPRCENHGGTYFGVLGLVTAQGDKLRITAGDVDEGFHSVTLNGRELFKAANSLIGHLRGGLGVATVLACGGFAAICGSSVATAATFSGVAYPEMRRFGYPQSFSTGVIAAGGTLGAMLPPSTVLAVYAILTQQDIGKLFMAGVLPGLLAMAMYVATIALIVGSCVTTLSAPTMLSITWRANSASAGELTVAG